MAGITHVIYDPPTTSLPYIVVALHSDGTVHATAFKSALKAESHCQQLERDAARAGVEKARR